jgi:hypothetical protein
MKLFSSEPNARIDSVQDFCEKLLINFVNDSAILYGKKFISYNIHNLIHLNNDVRFYGPLDSFSTYSFEKEVQVNKNLVRKCAKPFPQILNSIGDIKNCQKANKVIAVNCTELKDQHYDKLVIDGSIVCTRTLKNFFFEN